MSDLSYNLSTVRERIARAAESVGRDPAEVTLVAVSKTVPVDSVREAYDLGLKVFGESRLQEALPKMTALPSDIEWHFVGKLQSNKAKIAAETFAVIQTLENERQLREIAKSDRVVQGLIQVNIAEEPQKSGISAKLLGEFQKSVLQCRQLQFRGLMTIGPAHQNAEQARPFFRTMRELLDRMGGGWLSMGMSSDLEVAIQEGSTHVRIGTALFGERS